MFIIRDKYRMFLINNWIDIRQDWYMLFINSCSIGGYARNPSALNLNPIIKEFCINGNFFLNENEKQVALVIILRLYILLYIKNKL